MPIAEANRDSLKEKIELNREIPTKIFLNMGYQ